MLDSDRHTKTAETQGVFPASLVDVQERNTALISRANEIVVNTARAIWESEVELFRLGSEQAAKAFAPLKPGDDPATTVSTYWEQWQEGSERLLEHMRTVSDLARKCGWDLFRIYQEGLREATQPARARSR